MSAPDTPTDSAALVADSAQEISTAAPAETSVVSTNSNSNTQRQPSLLDSLLEATAPADDALSLDKRSNSSGFGLLCNDRSGLCLSATGAFLTDNAKSKQLQSLDDMASSGVYTSLTKLAQQLQTPDAGNPAASMAPLITIETDDFNVLVKEYDGHAIALKVPSAPPAASGTPGGSTNTATGSATSNGGETPSGLGVTSPAGGASN